MSALRVVLKLLNEVTEREPATIEFPRHVGDEEHIRERLLTSGPENESCERASCLEKALDCLCGGAGISAAME